MGSKTSKDDFIAIITHLQLSAFNLSDLYRETSWWIRRTARDNGQRYRVVVRQPHVHKYLQNEKTVFKIKKSKAWKFNSYLFFQLNLILFLLNEWSMKKMRVSRWL